MQWLCERWWWWMKYSAYLHSNTHTYVYIHVHYMHTTILHAHSPVPSIIFSLVWKKNSFLAHSIKGIFTRSAVLHKKQRHSQNNNNILHRRKMCVHILQNKLIIVIYFHACVCYGAWSNRAVLKQTMVVVSVYIFFSLLLVTYVGSSDFPNW